MGKGRHTQEGLPHNPMPLLQSPVRWRARTCSLTVAVALCDLRGPDSTHTLPSPGFCTIRLPLPLSEHPQVWPVKGTKVGNDFKLFIKKQLKKEL